MAWLLDGGGSPTDCEGSVGSFEPRRLTTGCSGRSAARPAAEPARYTALKTAL
jgi:hypothetical protein